MENVFTLTIEITERNKGLISKINQAMLDGIGGTETTVKPEKTVTETTVKPEKTIEKKDVKTGMTFLEFKTVAADCKKAHGIDFLKRVITDSGVTLRQSIPKTLTAIKEEKYAELVMIMRAGPVKYEEKTKTGPDDGFGPNDDDGFGPEEDDGFGESEEKDLPKVDPSAVKTALMAYSKTESRDAAKAIMIKHGVPNLNALADASQGALGGILKEVA